MAKAAADAVARYLASNKPKPAAKKPPGQAAMERNRAKPKPAAAPAPPPRRDRDDAGGGAAPGTDTGGTSYPVAPTAVTPENFVPTDFESYLGMFGLPADVQKELTAIFRGDSNTERAVDRAMAYVRSTGWYKTAYPGIQEAVAKGTLNPRTAERDYRRGLNDLNQIYKQYANRDVQLSEYAGHLREGVDASVVGRRFQGAAITNAYSNDWQYVSGAFGDGRLTGDETTALGRQQAGLDSPLGIKVARGIDEAQKKLSRIFQGQLATGVLSKLGQEERPPDIGN